MKGCDVCQRNKNYTEQPAGKLMPNSILEKPWTHISVDFITKLPLAQRYDSILVVVDRLMKMVKRAKETISLAQAKDAVPGPNCMLKSL